jgi:hypothetical protein
MRKVFFIPFIALLSACTTYDHSNQAAQRWQGGSFQALQQQWGIPDQVKVMKNGNTLYRYTTKRTQNFNAPTMTNYSTLVAPGHVAIGIPAPMQTPTGVVMQLQCTTWLEVNNKQVVVRVTSKGNDCQKLT